MVACLANIHHLFLTGGMPSVFKDYCHSAMLSAETPEVNSMNMLTFHGTGCSVTFIEADSTSQTAEQIMRHLPTFCGANLILAVITEVSDCVCMYVCQTLRYHIATVRVLPYLFQFSLA